MSKEIRIQPTNGADRALIQGDYIRRHKQTPNIFHEELILKCGLTKEKPTP